MILTLEEFLPPEVVVHRRGPRERAHLTDDRFGTDVSTLCGRRLTVERSSAKPADLAEVDPESTCRRCRSIESSTARIRRLV